MGNDSILPSDKGGARKPIDDGAIDLRLEGYSLERPRAKLQNSQFTIGEGNLDLSQAPDIFLARAESFRPEYFSALVDKRQERRDLLDDQLAKLKRDGANPYLTDELIKAFERDYDKIAPVLDRFEESKHYTNAQNSDNPDRLRELLKLQELMEWVNRAYSNGKDNSLERLTGAQQSELDTLEKVRKPAAAEPPAIKDALKQAQDREKRINDFNNGTGGSQSLGSIGGFRRGDKSRMPIAARTYMRPVDQQARDIVDGVLTKDELHNVPNILKRLADLKQKDHDLQAMQKKPSSDQEYAKVKAEKTALEQVNQPVSLGNALEQANQPVTLDIALKQAQWRALLIRREINGITPNETFLVRCFEDGKDIPAVIENPFNDPAKIPAAVASAIKEGRHHIEQKLIPDRYKSLSDQCASEALRGKIAHTDLEYWARLAERDALKDFRQATPQHERARALMIRQRLLGLDQAETSELMGLRYP